jgi:multidrug efflux pump subunit AcrB
MEKGISGNIAKAFITSKLSILLVVAFMLLGLFSILFIPREEDPQIKVPMADIMIGYPGASPTEVENSVVLPVEKIVSNVQGVEDVYSTSMNGMGMLTVQFRVGEDVERSLVKLYNELMKNMDRMPQGATMPLVKTRSIDDVPVMSFTLWSDKMSSYQIRQVAEVMANEIKKVPDVSQTQISGGQSRAVKVELDRDKMAASNVDITTVAQSLMANNSQMQSGKIIGDDKVVSVQTGNFFSSVDEIKNTIIGMNNGHPVYLYQIAQIEDGPQIPSEYVSFGYGAAKGVDKKDNPGTHSAVTISIAKKQGADAMKLSEAVLEKVNDLKTTLISKDLHVEESRNYGLTASNKVSELLLHLSIAILVVTLFVMLAMGWRGGLVVFLSIPITFALTLFAYYFTGYTLNRITLFALVFVTGIVTDDSIVIAENMHRHFSMKKLSPLKAALYAINEVGNPTILATLTVIAAVLPMAFVSGMMGPYMSPMPIGASIAMVFSLLIALTLTPYFGYLFLRHKSKDGDDDKIEKGKKVALYDSKLYKIYKKTMSPFLESRKKRWVFMILLAVILLGSMSLFYTKSVPVKMLPFDNKNDFQVVIDMPEGTTLERTAAVTQELAAYVNGNKDVTNYQTYMGCSAPISFNGLVRHYDMRHAENDADIQVNLTDKGERSEQSHDIAKSMRARLQKIGRKYGANVKVVEVPPGPPVMSTLVAEIYGPDYNKQVEIAGKVKDIFAKTDNVVDVDWTVEDDQPEYKFTVNKDKAMKAGIPTQQVVNTLHGVLSGMPVGVYHQPNVENQIGVNLQLPESEKSNVNSVLNMKIIGQQGMSASLSDLIDVSKGIKDKSIFRKNQQRVVYVTAEMAGNLESPIYAINSISEQLPKIKLPAGYSLNEDYKEEPKLEKDYTLKWDGEWKITYEVFRDLGLAFLFVLIIIYMLIVGWFQSFVTPLIQLSVIPLSLIGIILGHWVMGAYFSAPSMIGFIALAGIMVRNSILLIDFIEIRLSEGIPLKRAIIEAGAVRSTPIILTAGSVVLGAVVILFDPIFQGLAISLMGGTITSTLLTLIVVPLLYFKMMKNKQLKD